MKYRRDIDGLRTLAIVPVVLFHAGVPFFDGGFVGVDIFFVISGYLITGIILRELSENRFSFADFYARRFRRIYPMLILVVSCVLVAGAIFMTADEFRGVAATSFSSLVAVSNISFWHHQDYFNTDAYASPLLMTWSLGVEEQYYIIVPFLLMLLNRLSTRFLSAAIVAIIAISFVFSAWATFAQPTAAFYLLPSRAWELGVGALLASLELENYAASAFKRLNSAVWANALNIVGIVFIFGAIFLFNKNLPFPGALAAFPVIGTAALILSPSGFVSRTLLSHPIAVFIGQISYSWYLWHWPILSFLHVISITDLPLWVSLASVFVSFGLAVLSWNFVEATFRRRTLSRRNIILRYVGVVAVIAGCAFFIGKMGGLPQRLTPDARRVEAIVMSGRGDCLANFSDAHPDTSEHCIQLKPDSPSVALIGDSHAAALGPGLRAAAARANWGVAILTKSACRPLLNLVVPDRRHPQVAGTCNQFIKETLQFVTTQPGIKTVVIATYLTPDVQTIGAPRLQKGLIELVQALKSANKTVILINDVPAFNTLSAVHYEYARVIAPRGFIADLLQALAGKEFTTGPRTRDVQLQSPAITQAFAAAAQNAGAIVFDAAAPLCSGSECTFANDDGPYYIDAHHLSTLGSKTVMSHFDLNAFASPKTAVSY